MNNPEEENEDMIKAIREYGLRQEIGELHKKMMTSPAVTSTHTTPVINMARMIRRIAAAILFIILGGSLFLYFSTTADQLFDNKYIPYQASSSRSEQGEKDASTVQFFTDGQEALQNNKPQDAIDAFGKLLFYNTQRGRSILKDDTEFYLALAYLKSGKPAIAYNHFLEIYNNKNHLYNSEVTKWYLLRLKMLSWKNK